MAKSKAQLYAVIRLAPEASGVILEESLTKKEALDFCTAFDRKTSKEFTGTLPYRAVAVPHQKVC